MMNKSQRLTRFTFRSIELPVLLLLAAAFSISPAGVRANGLGFSAPDLLNQYGVDDSAALEGGVRAATDGAETWITVWWSRVDDNLGTLGDDADIFFSVSTDNGSSWSNAALIDFNYATTDGNTVDGAPHIATDGAGQWIVIWSAAPFQGATPLSDFDIVYSVSNDDGATWSPAGKLDPGAESDSAWDLNPRVFPDGQGGWIAAWESLLDSGPAGSDRDIFFSTSSNGATWTTATNLNSNAFVDTGDDANIRLATDGANGWVAVWDSDDDLVGPGDNPEDSIGFDLDILVAKSSDNGTTWTAPAALNSNASVPSAEDSHPTIARDALGNWLVVWQSSDSFFDSIGGDLDLLCAKADDDGTTWTAASILDSARAAADSDDDQTPDLATDGEGEWVVVWNAATSLTGDLHKGGIRVSRSSDTGSTWSDSSAIGVREYPYSATNPPAPNMTAGANGRWLGVWTSRSDPAGEWGDDDDLFYSISDDLDATISSAIAIY